MLILEASKRKIIWLICPTDSIPGESWGHKHSYKLLNLFESSDYEVLYWTSSFSHALKKQREFLNNEIILSKYSKIKIIKCCSYEKHVSFARFFSLLQFACKILYHGLKNPRPDFIVLAMSYPFGDIVTVILKKIHKAKLICDLRDLWPEVFTIFLPERLKSFSKYIFFLFYQMRKYTFDNSDAVIAVSKTYLNVALNSSKSLKDKISLVAYFSSYQLSEGIQLKDFDEAFRKRNTMHDFVVVYAGTLGSNYDMPTIVKAAKILSEVDPSIKFKIAGDGPLRNLFENYQSASSFSNLSYLGVLNSEQITELYLHTHVLMLNYSNESSVVFPAKVFDAFAFGIPIINSLKGELSDFIIKNKIGLQYFSGDPDSLANAILRLRNDKDLYHSCMHNLINIAPDFDSDIQYNKYFEVLSSFK